ncbi:hypothetical protein L3X37_07750 [Sabulilitoribacter arenilitoris]|uniref:Uncharacterized protein n=1 Tax=Wocania arenilitoris TaxID=2044858 RepID=A0AAE3JPH4_9FLAO|nr:hypothetical protein [Wocania arenilitoris]MCF7568255.1 hypothetical protein [Wocania arenilitoris]
MELGKDLIKDIDALLEKLFKDGYTSIHGQTSNIRTRSIHTCKALDLIRLKSNSTYELAEKGVFAIQDGGIEKYLSNIRTKKDLDIVNELPRSKLTRYQNYSNNLNWLE